MTSVEKLAAARGRTVEDVLVACRAADVVAWSAHAPLDDGEVAKVDAVLGTPPPPTPPPPAPPTPPTTPSGRRRLVAPGRTPIPPPPGGPPTGSTPVGPPIPPPPGPPAGYAPIGTPPPPTGRPLPPPPPGGPPAYGAPGFAGAPPPLTPRKRSWVRAALPAIGIAVLIGGRLTLGFVLGDVERDHEADELRERVEDIADADFRDNLSDEEGAFALAVGDCFQDRSSLMTADEGELVDAAVLEVDCATAHDAEVYEVRTIPDAAGAPFPGELVVADTAAQGCASTYEAFVGGPYPSADLDIAYLFPSEATWDGLDDRRVICAVVTADGSPRTGTAQGLGAGASAG